MEVGAKVNRFFSVPEGMQIPPEPPTCQGNLRTVAVTMCWCLYLVQTKNHETTDINTTKTLYSLDRKCCHSIFTMASHYLGVTITLQSTYLTVYEDEEESKESEPILTCLESAKTNVNLRTGLEAEIKEEDTSSQCANNRPRSVSNTSNISSQSETPDSSRRINATVWWKTGFAKTPSGVQLIDRWTFLDDLPDLQRQIRSTCWYEGSSSSSPVRHLGGNQGNLLNSAHTFLSGPYS